jgi:cytochrome c-type biogenesis protein CcmE
MRPRRQRMLLIGAVVAGMTIAAGFAYRAFRENLLYYFVPTQVAAGEAPHREFRIGGMVVKHSVQRAPGSLTVRFVLTDFAHEVPVMYTGVLPDLFREGQGIVARGKLDASGTFVAEEVLAKHDEKYMPPDIAAANAKARPTVTE